MSPKIRIMTDSASDIPYNIEKELNIKILSFPVTVDNVSYMERIDFDAERFYDMLEGAQSLPTTSQITPFRFCEEYKRQYKKGYKELIYVSINSKGSNTYNAAIMAKEMFYTELPHARDELNIHIIDSKTYTIAYGYPVVEAAKMISKGEALESVLDYLDDWFNSVEVFFAPYTLQYAKKSGRISCASAFVGELLGLRPIIHIIDGDMNIIQKVRGDKSIVPALLKSAVAHKTPDSDYCLVKSRITTDYDLLYAKATKEFGAKPADAYKIGAAICINSGPLVSGIVIKGNNRKPKG